MGRYRVMIDDNFHYMDENERVEHGEFATATEALAAAQGIVEASLRSLHTAGMTAADLLAQYALFGDDSFVIAVDGAEAIKFSAREHAQSFAPTLITTPNRSME